MWSNIAEILTRVSTLASNNIVWKKIEESWFIRVFLKKKANPKFGLFVQFNHPFPPEDGRNGENYKQYGGGGAGGRTSASGLSKYVKIKALSPFIFSGKARLLFCNIWTGFSNLAAFLGTTPIFLEKNELDYLMKISMINRLATISNPKSEKAKTSYALF